MATRAPVRVLLVEDDPDVVEVLCLALRRRGCLVESAQSGEEGLLAAKRFCPDVVICDLDLHGGPDGFAVAAALKADPAACHARLFAFTAYSGLEAEVFQAGFDEYLVKPADVHKLLTIVESASSVPP